MTCLKIIRPANVFIVFLVTSTAHILFSGGWESAAFWGALALSLSAAAGNVINDIFDLPTDKINRPGRPLPSGVITQRAARGFYLTLLAGSMVFAVRINVNSLIFIASVNVLLYFYSAKLKATAFTGNVTVALLTSSSFLYAGFLSHKLYDAFYFAGFAFLSNLGREFIKDIEDINGDRESGMRTLPVIIGGESSRKIVIILLAAVPAAIVISAFLQVFSPMFLIISLCSVVPLYLLSIYDLLRPDWMARLRGISLKIKISMLFGLVALLAGYAGL